MRRRLAALLAGLAMIVGLAGPATADHWPGAPNPPNGWYGIGRQATVHNGIRAVEAYCKLDDAVPDDDPYVFGAGPSVSAWVAFVGGTDRLNIIQVGAIMRPGMGRDWFLVYGQGNPGEPDAIYQHVELGEISPFAQGWHKYRLWYKVPWNGDSLMRVLIDDVRVATVDMRQLDWLPSGARAEAEAESQDDRMGGWCKSTGNEPAAVADDWSAYPIRRQIDVESGWINRRYSSRTWDGGCGDGGPSDCPWEFSIHP